MRRKEAKRGGERERGMQEEEEKGREGETEAGGGEQEPT